jgi:hypothetical protein
MAAQKGEMGYWAQNASKGYKSTGFAGGPTALSNLITRVTLRLLAGQGAKTTDIPWPQPQISEANYKQYSNPSWTLETPGTVEQPVSTFWKERDLDSLFVHPNRKAAKF